MAKRRRSNAAPRAVALDHGPAIRLARGDLELHDGPDPDMPSRTVRRARLVVHYLRLCQTDTQREACDRLCVQAERAGGAAWRPDGVVVRVDFSASGHPTTQQVAATADLRHARAAVGEAAWALLQAVVVSNVAISEQASSGDARAVLRGRFLAAVDRLAEHWRM